MAQVTSLCFQMQTSNMTRWKFQLCATGSWCLIKCAWMKLHGVFGLLFHYGGYGAIGTFQSKPKCYLQWWGRSYEPCSIPGKGLDSCTASVLKASFRITKRWGFFSLCPILRLKYCVAENTDWFLPCSELHPDSARKDKCAVGILSCTRHLCLKSSCNPRTY